MRAYDALAVGDWLLLVDDHEPDDIRDRLDLDDPRGHRWEALAAGPDAWHVRITRLSSTPLPRVVHDTAAEPGSGEVSGALWKLQMSQRDLDSNVIQLPAGVTIDAHAGPDLDVLVHVVHGSGQLVTELDTIELRPGVLLWLPRRSRRQFTAGPRGLRYLTVHQRRQSLTLGATRAP